MSEICEHDTFKDICVACHRGDTITRLTAEMKRLRAALKRLSFLAQTTGGTAGRDEELCAAIAEAEAILIKEPRT